MKLMILNAVSADKDLILFLESQTGLEVITPSSNQLASVMNQRTQEAKLQAFQSLMNGKQISEPEPDDADWNTIDNLEHNKFLDSNKYAD